MCFDRRAGSTQRAPGGPALSRSIASRAFTVFAATATSVNRIDAVLPHLAIKEELADLRARCVLRSRAFARLLLVVGGQAVILAAGRHPTTQTGGSQVPFARAAKIDFKARRARSRS
jgi:hypothetical protein